MSGSRFVLPNQQIETPSGAPGVGYLAYFYETGTDSPQATYNDAAFTVPNPNPVPADASGSFGSIFMLSSPNYRVTITDADGVQIWTMDPVGPNAGGGSGSQVPIGGMLPFGGAEAGLPAGYLICGGQAVSRTTYSGLFAVIGTAYGSGDGATTFNVPDKRGRVSVGKDDMGGSAANRVTSGVSGISGTTLGAAGGDQHAQTDTLSASASTTVTLTDGGHAHVEQFNPNAFGQSNGPGAAGTGAGGPVASALSTESATTGITASASTTVTVTSGLTGSSQNMPPAQIDNWIIRAT